MKNNGSLGVFLVSCLFAAPAFSAHSEPALNSSLSSWGLDSTQIAQIEKEEQVALFKFLSSGDAWPQATLFDYVKATPEEAAAVFFDYQNHCKILPDCTRVSPEKMDSLTYQVTYTVNLPWPYNSETYQVKDTLSSDQANLSYQISWQLTHETENTKDSKGWIRFEPMGSGTLMIYQNHITPNRWGAGMFVNQANEKVKSVASAIKKYIEKEKLESNELLANQLEALRAALKK